MGCSFLHLRVHILTHRIGAFREKVLPFGLLFMFPFFSPSVSGGQVSHWQYHLREVALRVLGHGSPSVTSARQKSNGTRNISRGSVALMKGLGSLCHLLPCDCVPSLVVPHLCPITCTSPVYLNHMFLVSLLVCLWASVYTVISTAILCDSLCYQRCLLEVVGSYKRKLKEWEY